MYMEKVCSKDQRLSFVDLWDDFCRPGMGVNPVKTLLDKSDPSGVHVNPEGAKQLVSHIKNFMSIDRLGEYETPSGKKRTRSSASTPGSAEKQLPKRQNSSLEETETHCTKIVENEWKKEWGGLSFWCNETSVSKGVAILVKPNLDINVTEKYRDGEGRKLIVELKLDSNETVRIFNVYAPNNGIERKNFFNKLIINNENDVVNYVMGDFNCCLNRKLDRKHMPKCEDVGNHELKNFIGKNELTDIWRLRYPNKKQYMFSRENDGTQQNLNEVEQLKNDIYKYYEQKPEAARIRSKINWYEKGEKSTNYFFRLEQKRGKEKLWSKIKAENGTFKNNINEILGEQLKYYEKLFTSGGCNREAGEKLLHNVNKTLSEAEKRLCDSEIMKDEIFKAIKLMKKDKSPGEDGITAEFYQEYWFLIQNELTQILKETFFDKTLSE
ncbi:unnamed protein product [Mytilus coruscus]|uniref:Endonuclease/exonuclease/phosphatase domain-containing protein n=1 Tax=Mytilus coruscus TaxID=42192 RepID=A0A6J8EJC4_MYTCO|nr:unnamed protein product [Mytilus coruscus]